MKFSDLDVKMRRFETAHDHCVLPDIYMVARLDGRNFTRLTKEVHPFAKPFDEGFRDLMIRTTAHLMECGFNVVYGYTQSDEISLLLHRDEGTFSRKLRKLNSVLAGEASARFSTLLGDVAAFDCRISQLPTLGLVREYFQWRAEDAGRNALHAHCYWMLRDEGNSVAEATGLLDKLSFAGKNEFLFGRGKNFNALPLWEKRGCGLYWELYDKASVNPVTGEPASAVRRRIKVDMELPMKDDYGELLRRIATTEQS